MAKKDINEKRRKERKTTLESVKNFETEGAKRLAKEFFGGYTNSKEVSLKLKNKIKSSTAYDYAKVWKNADCFHTKKFRKITKVNNGTSYMPLLEYHTLKFDIYLNDLLKRNISLSPIQRKFLMEKFDSPDSLFRLDVIESNKDSIFDAIDEVIKEKIILNYIQNQFFKLLGRKNNELIRNKSEEKMIVDLMKVYSDNLTKESVLNYFKLYLFNLIRENNFSNFTDYLCEIIEAIEGKKELPKDIFFIGAIGGFDITKIITPLYKKMNKANPEERNKIIEHFRLNSAWYGYEVPVQLNEQKFSNSN